MTREVWFYECYCNKCEVYFDVDGYPIECSYCGGIEDIDVYEVFDDE